MCIGRINEFWVKKKGSETAVALVTLGNDGQKRLRPETVIWEVFRACALCSHGTDLLNAATARHKRIVSDARSDCGNDP